MDATPTRKEKRLWLVIRLSFPAFLICAATYWYQVHHFVPQANYPDPLGPLLDEMIGGTRSIYFLGSAFFAFVFTFASKAILNLHSSQENNEP